jgi:acetyl esterase/lipase
VDGSTILNAWTLVPTHQFSFAVSQYFKLSSHKRRYDKNVWKTWFQGTTTKTLESTILHLYSVVQKNLETDDTNPLYERRDDGYDSWNNETPLVVFEEFPYGSHPRQVLHVIRPTTTKTTSLLFFVHGGAWGSGFPELYRLVATPFVQVNYTVAILGYRTYPTSNVQGQVQDIANAIKTLVRKLQHSVPFNFNASHPKLDVTLMGHSSGAHLCSLGILQGQIRGVDRLVAIAGVYDIPTHYVYEASRGVERISPMAPACGGASLNRWRRCSPTYLLQKKRNTQHIHEDGEAAKNPHTFPPTLLCHGTADATVPYRQTINFFQAITQWYGLKHDVQLEILEEVEHSETVLQLMFGGPTLDVVLGWIQQGRTVQKESTTTK